MTGFKRWWKLIIGFTLIAVVLVGTIVFLQPRKYLSVATAIPASSYTADKASVYSENIQHLYSSLGVSDDLDRIIGTAQLDTIYLALAAKLSLATHYKLDKSSQPLIKAAKHLKKNSEVIKSEYGELKVKVWDENSAMAATIANELLNQLSIIHGDLKNESNKIALQTLTSFQTQLHSQIDSLNGAGTGELKDKTLERESLIKTFHQNNELLAKYKLMVETKPPAILVVEPARASIKPNKPERLLIIAATFFLALVFSIVLSIVLDWMRDPRK